VRRGGRRGLMNMEGEVGSGKWEVGSAGSGQLVLSGKA
jgi:hypothetical protein